jgi:translation initiation factor 3 subunit G
MMSGGGDDSRGTENTLRVSNLTKAVTEDDIRDLFERFGKILRVSIPMEEDREKDKDGKVVMVPRGYAYLVFARREDAEVALDRLNGHGYDHLILRVEWAKPPREGSMNSTYQSGYGKKLAQDTNEQARFFSQH